MAFTQTYDDQRGNGAASKEKQNGGKSPNSLPSYTAMIAQAILSKSAQRCALNEIYEFMERRFPPLKEKGNGWRNCVRHTLSLSDCFMKLHRPENGRSCHWAIHPTYLPRFMRGDFRKRRQTRARRNTQGSFQDQYNFQAMYERDSTLSYDNRMMHLATASAPASNEVMEHGSHYHIPTCTSMMPSYSHVPPHLPHMSQTHSYLHGQHNEQQQLMYQNQFPKEYKPMNGYFEPYPQEHRPYYPQ